MPKNECSSIGRANILLILQVLSDFGDQITTTLLARCVDRYNEIRAKRRTLLESHY